MGTNSLLIAMFTSKIVPIILYPTSCLGIDYLKCFHTRLKEEIGSGQFGTVYKGVWQSADEGEVEVAVKTLKEQSVEEDRVKFLQEAATMGQFKHPNVVEMYGVVTRDMPVSTSFGGAFYCWVLI